MSGQPKVDALDAEAEATAAAAAARPAASAAWSPLRHVAFRSLWFAALCVYLAIWMQSVAGAWLMTTLTRSALLVALMQTAISLPMFLWSLPAGVLADLTDRRRLLITTQLIMMLASAALATASMLGWIGTFGLLALTFLLGSGLALNGPAWQASMCESVPRHEIAQALTLIGIAYNIARAVGPAIAGVLQAAVSPGLVFLVNAVAYAWVLGVVWRWRSPALSSALPPERLVSGILSGLRYAAHAGAVRAPVIRTAAFMLPASALWALLPVVGQGRLGASAAGFGLLIGSLGVGAIVAGVSLSWLRQRFAVEASIAVASVSYAVVLVLSGVLTSVWVLCPVLMIGGASWSVSLTLLNAAMLTSIPTWVRSRTIALYMLGSQGFMAAGAALWGALASGAGTELALAAAGGLMLLTVFWGRRHRVRFGVESDVTLSPAEPQLDLRHALAPEAGPVAVEIRYRIDPADREAFLHASEAVGTLRRRNGARRWRLYRDLSDDRIFAERFIVDSWADYQRQLARSTVADQSKEVRLRAFQEPGVPIETGHYLAER
ncbi:MAG TPA: MFS transporter [Burkholderiaceae bacterium]